MPAAALMQLPEEDVGAEGVALFSEIRTRNPDIPVILFTAWTHLESAVQLIKAGAADYIAKPWDNNKLLATVENLLELAEGTRERDRVRRARRQRREHRQGPGSDDPR